MNSQLSARTEFHYFTQPLLNIIKWKKRKYNFRMKNAIGHRWFSSILVCKVGKLSPGDEWRPLVEHYSEFSSVDSPIWAERWEEQDGIMRTFVLYYGLICSDVEGRWGGGGQSKSSLIHLLRPGVLSRLWMLPSSSNCKRKILSCVFSFTIFTEK